MKRGPEEEELLRSVTLQNAASILLARQRAEEELIQAKEALERRTVELARSLAMMSATLEATTDGILVTDDHGRINSFNQRYMEIWPLPRQVIDSLDHWQALEVCSRLFARPRDFLAGVKQIYDSAPPESFDLLELADGRVFERFSHIQFIEGHNAGRVWSFRDITERRRAEVAQFRLAAIVTSSSDAIVSKTLEGIITTWNRGAERIFGYAAEEVVGKSITILIPTERLDEETMILDRIKRGEPIEHYETVRLRKDGRPIDVSLTVSPVKDVQGRIIGASKIARDITQRKRTEEALHDETRILELLNSTGAAIGSTLDLQMLLQTVTDAATQISGAEFGAFFYNTTDEAGDAFQLYALSGAPREAFEQFGHPRATPLFRPTFVGESPIRLADVQMDPRYGQMSPHFGMPAGHLPVRSYMALPVVSRSGEVIGGLFFGHHEPGIFSDRTERIMVGIAAQAAVAIDNARLYEDVKQAASEREQLLKAERAARSEAERVSLMKDEFLATLSHELRTPLSAILGWSQLLLSGGEDAEELKLGLEAIARNARAQTQLIEDLLDMSRIVSGKVRLDVQLVDLASVVDTAVESIRPSAEAKEILLRKIIDPLAGPVSGDPGRLQQVVWNLLSNAVKFTPKRGRVDVVVQRINSHLEVVVRDTGMGIGQEFLPHVFERFRQADASTTRKYGGLGLGLSIVKQLIELHGGNVRVTSEGEGRGATFVVTIPLAPVRMAGKREHPTTSPSPAFDCEQFNLSGVKVLIVDDEPDARQLIKRMLVQCQAEVIVAANAAEGLALLTSERPNVIVSDIGMPERDGYQLIRDVRKLPASQGGQTPAVALTAFARSEDRTRAMVAGYHMHISKPVEPQELLATVARLAGRIDNDQGE
jgi:PAS domain S-box-containing protein